MHKKTKGAIAELHVCADLMKRGWRILLPYGENHRYDVVAEKDGRFLRVQVKYVTPKNGKLYVNCQSSNNWSVDPYTAAQIDVIAAFNPQDQHVYYVPVGQICKSAMALRLEPTRNGQKKKVRYAKDFGEFPGFVKEASLFSYSSIRTMERSWGQVPEWLKGLDCKSSDREVYGGSNPSLPITFISTVLLSEMSRKDSKRAPILPTTSAGVTQW